MHVANCTMASLTLAKYQNSRQNTNPVISPVISPASYNVSFFFAGIGWITYSKIFKNFEFNCFLNIFIVINNLKVLRNMYLYQRNSSISYHPPKKQITKSILIENKTLNVKCKQGSCVLCIMFRANLGNWCWKNC